MKRLLLFNLFVLFVYVPVNLFAQQRAIDFDGVDDNVYCWTPFSPAVTSGTIEFWVNIDAIPSNNPRLIANGPNYNTGDDIYISAGEGKIRTTGSFVDGDDLVSTAPLTVGTWTHIAISADENGSTLYINGEIDDTGGAAAFSFTNFRFGGQFTSGFFESINGKMDEVRVWNDIRTQQEIRDNMYSELSNPTGEANLVAYYMLNETSVSASGTTADNAQGNSDYDATIYCNNSVGGAIPLYVDKNASGTPNGSSWTNAYTSLQSALDIAYSGNEIWVAAGTYAPSYDYELGGGSSYYHFRMVNGVTIYGGFSGDETSVTSRTDFGDGGANETILDGTGRYHIFYHPSGVGLDATAVLDGFTLSGGNASSTTAPHGYGGGIYNESCSPTIKNCIFQNNGARTSGGAIFNTASSPNIINSLFINNNATNFGGGAIYNHLGSSATIVNCTFSGNSSDKGGAMYNAWADPSVTNCIFWNNTATTSENEIFNQSSSPTFVYCDIEGGYTGTGNINSNPKFAGSGDYPYAITGSSPCVDAGTNTGVTEAYDIRGSGFTRTQNSTTDIGAYEYKAGTDMGGIIIYVNNVAVGDDNGTSWANAYPSLQSALDAASSGDEIWVAKGIYKPSYDYGLNLASPNTERGYHFRMINGVSIYGGFAGNETTVASRTDFGEGGTNETILSGDIGTEGDASDNCYHIFYHPNVLGLTTTALIDGFTISGANANGSSPHDMGGAMYNHTNSPAINFCTIKANSSSHGGGMYFQFSSPLITNSTFSGNSVSGYGGGLNLYLCDGVDITNCLFVSNTASNRGGGIYLESSSPFILNCTFSGNSSGNGGALYNFNSGPPIQNTIFWGNTATISGSEIFNYSSLPTFSYCNVQGSDRNGNFDSNLGRDDGSSIDSNPKFAGSGDYPYAIAGTSPCADAGTNSGVTEIYDIRGAGFSRTQNSTTDMGAYEYTDGTDPEGGIIYVNASPTSDGNNGSSWSDAYLSLQSGIDAATSGDQIWVAKGTYKPEQEVDGTTDTPASYLFFLTTAGIPDIYGGFAGTETATNQRTDFAEGGLNETILSGDLGGSVYCKNILKYNNASNSTILDGFTFSWAVAGTSGALYLTSSSPSIKNCTFTNNSSSTTTNSAGGAIYLSTSNSIIDNCIFHNNSAKFGGAIYITASSLPMVKNSVFYTNTAASNGGALGANTTGATILNCLFYDNSSTNSWGGTIDNANGTYNYINCTFTNNTNISGGAAFYVRSGNVNIKNCIIWNNTDQNEAYPDNIYIASGANVSYYYSNIEGSGGSSNWDNDYGVDLTNNIDEDPIFVNPTTNDYRIAGTSPCADAGNSAYNSENYDIRGTGFARKLNKTDGTAGTIDMGAYEYLYGTDPADVTLIWTAGASTSTWGTAANWDLGVVPSAAYNVNIPDLAIDPVISSTTSASCKNLTVENEATLTIQSDATNNGSLIVGGTSTGNVTYNRWMTADKWHLVSAPVGGQLIADFISGDNLTYLATNTTKYGLALYNNSTPNWEHYTTSGTSDSFTTGKGYEIMRKTSDGTFAFTGSVATNDVSIAITAPSGGNAWNLVGNPYTSAINGNDASGEPVVTNFLTKNAAKLALSNQAIYVWDNNKTGGAGYVTINHSNEQTYLAPGQAFFVNAVGDGTVTFEEGAQTHQTGNIFKSGTIANPTIKLFAERSEGTSSTNIKYIEDMTTGLDPGYDGGRFSGGDNSFAVYTHLVGDETNLVDFDIQCLPSGDFTQIIPVGLNAPENTEVVFRAEAINLPAGTPVYLEDKATATFTALHEPGSFYNVTIAAKTEGTGRFFLHTKSAATGINPIASSNDFMVITRPQYNSIRVLGSFENQAEIAIYDMAGRKLLTKKLNDTDINDVEMGGLISGFYLVSISSPTQKVSKKISWVTNQ